MNEPLPTRRRRVAKPEPIEGDEPMNVNQIELDQRIERDINDAHDDAQSKANDLVPPTRATRSMAPWGQVVTSIYDIDIQATYRRLTDDLSLGDGATEYGAVLAAMDAAERNAFDASRLYRHAKLEEDRVTMEVDKKLEILRSSSRAELDKEKSDGIRSKAPTLQDIEDRMIASWPDDVAKHRQKIAEIHGAARVIEDLAGLWRSRCATLRVICERVTPNR
jgi:hypothetical protein